MPDAAALGSDLPEAGRAEVARIDRHHRRGFSRAVALHRSQPETILERRGQALRQFLRAGQDKLDTAKLFRRAGADVNLQECRCGQQKRYPVLAHQLADAAAIDRVWVIHRARAEQRRQPQRAGEAERVEKRQDAENPVIPIQRKRLANLLNVRDDVVVREHHALGCAGAAARENDRGQVVHRCLVFAAEKPLQQPNRQQRSGQGGSELAANADRLGDVLEQNRLHRHVEFDLLEKRFRRDHRTDVALLDARTQRLRGERVVEVHRHPARQRGGVVDQRTGDRRWHEDADHLLPLPPAAQRPAKRNRADQRAAATHAAALGIRREKPERMFPERPHETPVQRLHVTLAMRPGVRAEFLHRLTHLGRISVVR